MKKSFKFLGNPTEISRETTGEIPGVIHLRNSGTIAADMILLNIHLKRNS